MSAQLNVRLKTYLEQEKIDPPDLYKKMGVTRTTWSNWINEGQAIPLKRIIEIIDFLPELDVRWLLTGNYQETIGNIPEKGQDNCKNCDVKDKLIDSYQNLIDRYEKFFGKINSENQSSH